MSRDTQPRKPKFFVEVLRKLRRRHTTATARESRLAEHQAAIEVYEASQEQMDRILQKIVEYLPLANQIGVPAILNDWERLLRTHEDIRLIVDGGFITLSSHHFDSPEATEARSGARTLGKQLKAHRWNVDNASSKVTESLARMQLKAMVQQESSSTDVPTGEVSFLSAATETVVVKPNLNSNSSSAITDELVDLRKVNDVELSLAEETEWLSNSAEGRMTWMTLDPDENPWQ
ncbi:hypothetical protein E1B28_000199 [Marasmius oreades]|uniref:Uncharacterized protein n=1 Tax=Marasmius oreades TaxID=181124 RepID=A0A9P8AE38_9AGAR|nr:uncharacterized protein E1B28_000199 [Marasmius oreades]KAG7098232.1 hypothetical protein E1B28_000199 [Marasmius oreades]